MKTKALRKLFFFFLLYSCLYTVVLAQNAKSYEILPSPDMWYNHVDGIRVGARFLGQVPGTFEDGPHRLNAGLWLGTWLPEYPVSYYVSFTEPIPAISGFNSEGNISLMSSIRTGLSRHGLSFNKRWQKGFDENNFIALSIGSYVQKLFEKEYLAFPVMWQQKWLWLGRVQLMLQNNDLLGRYSVRTELVANLAGEVPSFSRWETEIKQYYVLGSGFEFRGRLFIGIASDHTTPEFLFSRSFRSPYKWIDNEFSRAKGTIPTPWMESGIFQVAGGANLRGYSKQDINILVNGSSPLVTSIGGANIELDYPNPIDKAVQNIPVLGKLVKLRSYLFFDSGTSLGLTSVEESRLLFDAGGGFMFSLNIPDVRGNFRGIMLRYDIPLWLSNPDQEHHITYRNTIGIGAIFVF